MEDLRIMAESLSQKNEIITMLIDIGYKRDLFLSCDNDCLMGIHVYSSGEIQDVLDEDYNDKRHKELTIQQLRDLVVLRRNDVGDATHTDQDGWKWYIGADSYVWQVGNSQQLKQWDQSSLAMVDLKPIEKEMRVKEYLDKDYVLRSVKQTTGDNRVPDGWIEVPEGAAIYVVWEDPNDLRMERFYKDEFCCVFKNDDWIETPSVNLMHIQKTGGAIVWQRSEAENTKQLTGIEATLAERQATYGCFEDVARTTEQIMKALADPRVNGLNELPYPHRMALYMIASKMSRIVNGDFNSIVGWHDIAGYATLVERLIGGDNV